MLKRVHFPTSPLPYLLVAPQVVITLIFFIWPATQAVYQSFLIEDAFGMSTEFVWFENFVYLANDQQYLESFGRTIFFFSLRCVSVNVARTHSSWLCR